MGSLLEREGSFSFCDELLRGIPAETDNPDEIYAGAYPQSRYGALDACWMAPNLSVTGARPDAVCGMLVRALSRLDLSRPLHDFARLRLSLSNLLKSFARGAFAEQSPDVPESLAELSRNVSTLRSSWGEDDAVLCAQHLSDLLDVQSLSPEALLDAARAIITLLSSSDTTAAEEDASFDPISTAVSWLSASEEGDSVQREPRGSLALIVAALTMSAADESSLASAVPIINEVLRRDAGKLADDALIMCALAVSEGVVMSEQLHRVIFIPACQVWNIRVEPRLGSHVGSVDIRAPPLAQHGAHIGVSAKLATLGIQTCSAAVPAHDALFRAFRRGSALTRTAHHLSADAAICVEVTNKNRTEMIEVNALQAIDNVSQHQLCGDVDLPALLASESQRVLALSTALGAVAGRGDLSGENPPAWAVVVLRRLVATSLQRIEQLCSPQASMLSTSPQDASARSESQGPVTNEEALAFVAMRKRTRETAARGGSMRSSRVILDDEDEASDDFDDAFTDFEGHSTRHNPHQFSSSSAIEPMLLGSMRVRFALWASQSATALTELTLRSVSLSSAAKALSTASASRSFGEALAVSELLCEMVACDDATYRSTLQDLLSCAAPRALLALVSDSQLSLEAGRRHFAAALASFSNEQGRQEEQAEAGGRLRRLAVREAVGRVESAHRIGGRYADAVLGSSGNPGRNRSGSFSSAGSAHSSSSSEAGGATSRSGRSSRGHSRCPPWVEDNVAVAYGGGLLQLLVLASAKSLSRIARACAASNTPPTDLVASFGLGSPEGLFKDLRRIATVTGHARVAAALCELSSDLSAALGGEFSSHASELRVRCLFALYPLPESHTLPHQHVYRELLRSGRHSEPVTPLLAVGAGRLGRQGSDPSPFMSVRAAAEQIVGGADAWMASSTEDALSASPATATFSRSLSALVGPDSPLTTAAQLELLTGLGACAAQFCAPRLVTSAGRVSRQGGHSDGSNNEDSDSEPDANNALSYSEDDGGSVDSASSDSPSRASGALRELRRLSTDPDALRHPVLASLSIETAPGILRELLARTAALMAHASDLVTFNEDALPAGVTVASIGHAAVSEHLLALAAPSAASDTSWTACGAAVLRGSAALLRCLLALALSLTCSDQGVARIAEQRALCDCVGDVLLPAASSTVAAISEQGVPMDVEDAVCASLAGLAALLHDGSKAVDAASGAGLIPKTSSRTVAKLRQAALDVSALLPSSAVHAANRAVDCPPLPLPSGLGRTRAAGGRGRGRGRGRGGSSGVSASERFGGLSGPISDLLLWRRLLAYPPRALIALSLGSCEDFGGGATNSSVRLVQSAVPASAAAPMSAPAAPARTGGSSSLLRLRGAPLDALFGSSSSSAPSLASTPPRRAGDSTVAHASLLGLSGAHRALPLAGEVIPLAPATEAALVGGDTTQLRPVSMDLDLSEATSSEVVALPAAGTGSYDPSAAFSNLEQAQPVATGAAAPEAHTLPAPIDTARRNAPAATSHAAPAASQFAAAAAMATAMQYQRYASAAAAAVAASAVAQQVATSRMLMPGYMPAPQGVFYPTPHPYAMPQGAMQPMLAHSPGARLQRGRSASRSRSASSTSSSDRGRGRASRRRRHYREGVVSREDRLSARRHMGPGSRSSHSEDGWGGSEWEDSDSESSESPERGRRRSSKRRRSRSGSASRNRSRHRGKRTSSRSARRSTSRSGSARVRGPGRSRSISTSRRRR